MSSLTESIVEEATLSWLGELGYASLFVPDIAPGELFAERTRLTSDRERFLPWMKSFQRGK